MFTLIKTNDFTNTKTIKTVEIQVLFSILFGLIFDIEVNHMEYFINGKLTGERTFWSAVNTLAGEYQKKLLLNVNKVRIAESLYWMCPAR